MKVLKKYMKVLKKTITRPLVIIIVVTAIITAIITEITHGLISTAYRYATDLISPVELQLSLTQLMIYRTSPDDFPICEMDILVKNPSDRNSSVELKILTIFRENIIYRFTAGQEVIKAEPNDLILKHITIKDKVLDLALKIPQDSSSAMIKLTYLNVRANSKDSIILKDDDVIKCTYWQVPLFGSEQEALSLGAVSLDMKRLIFYTDTKRQTKGKALQIMTLFTDKQGLGDLNLNKAAEKQWIYTVGLTDSSSFRRKYGGIYLGYIASDSIALASRKFASQVLGSYKDNSLYSLTAIGFNRDFSHILEFIHYTFDPARNNELFKHFQQNANFYIHLYCEHDRGIARIVNSFNKRGYGTGVTYIQGFIKGLESIVQMTPDLKLCQLAEELNKSLGLMNSVIQGDGCFVFFPMNIEPKRKKEILSDIVYVTGKYQTFDLSFDCHPFRSIPSSSPFKIPILVFLNFSDNTKKAVLDSIKGY